MICVLRALICCLIILNCFLLMSNAVKEEAEENGGDFLDELWRRTSAAEETNENARQQFQSERQNDQRNNAKVIIKSEPKVEPVDEQFPTKPEQSFAQFQAVKDEPFHQDEAVKVEPKEEPIFDHFSNENEFIDEQDTDQTNDEESQEPAHSDHYSTASNQYSDQRVGHSKVPNNDTVKKFIKIEESASKKGIKLDNETYAKIAEKLGVSTTKILRWKEYFGNSQHKYDENQKIAFVRQTEALKNKFPEIKYTDIAQQLKISLKTLNKWRRLYPPGFEPAQKATITSDKQRIKMIDKFMNLKKERLLSNRSNKLAKKIDDEISKELGIGKQVIGAWKRKFGLAKANKKYSTEEKKRILVQFMKQKKNRPTVYDKQIISELGISETTFNVWKKEFNLPVKQPNASYTQKEKITFVRKFYSLKNRAPAITMIEAAKILKVNLRSFRRWKKEFDNGLLSSSTNDDYSHMMRNNNFDNTTDEESAGSKENKFSQSEGEGFDIAEEEESENSKKNDETFDITEEESESFNKHDFLLYEDEGFDIAEEEESEPSKENEFYQSEDDDDGYHPPPFNSKAWSWNLSPTKRRKLFNEHFLADCKFTENFFKHA